jgi:hypothetical protein
MIRRCTSPKEDSYQFYGARGITVCDRWRASFQNFYADMGDRPSPKHTIDRIKSDGNYEPGNCRWATQKEQQRNRTNNTILKHDGQEMCVAAWAEKLGVTAQTIHNRLRKGLPMAAVLYHGDLRLKQQPQRNRKVPA